MRMIAAARRDSKSCPMQARSWAVISASVKKGYTTSGSEGFSVPDHGVGVPAAPLGLDPPEAYVEVPVMLLSERWRRPLTLAQQERADVLGRHLADVVRAYHDQEGASAMTWRGRRRS